MDGFPKLVQVIDTPRRGMMAFFEDGSVAYYDHDIGIWRPATAHISYRDLFTEDRQTDNTSVADASFVLRDRLALSPDVAVED